MAEIILSQGKVALVDDADAGMLNQWKWTAAWTGHRWYAVRNVGHRIYMHRVVMGLGVGRIPEVDHRNGDGLDNRHDNLRVTTHSRNAANSDRRPNAAGLRGVDLKKGREHHRRPYTTQITTNGKLEHLGYFATAEEAGHAYDAAARAAFGEFARTNYPAV